MLRVHIRGSLGRGRLHPQRSTTCATRSLQIFARSRSKWSERERESPSQFTKRTWIASSILILSCLCDACTVHQKRSHERSGFYLALSLLPGTAKRKGQHHFPLERTDNRSNCGLPLASQSDSDVSMHAGSISDPF